LDKAKGRDRVKARDRVRDRAKEKVKDREKAKAKDKGKVREMDRVAVMAEAASRLDFPVHSRCGANPHSWTSSSRRKRYRLNPPEGPVRKPSKKPASANVPNWITARFLRNSARVRRIC
jgi:hypothetical protein